MYSLLYFNYSSINLTGAGKFRRKNDGGWYDKGAAFQVERPTMAWEILMYESRLCPLSALARMQSCGQKEENWVWNQPAVPSSYKVARSGFKLRSVCLHSQFSLPLAASVSLMRAVLLLPSEDLPPASAA